MIEILKKAAGAGGGVLRKYFRQPLEITQKTSIHDIVTVADHEAQGAIVDSIRKSVAGTELEGKIGFIGEEGLYEAGEYTFVIDPLDGTNNFSSHIPYFCVSIGMYKGRKCEAGVIYNPVEDVFYTAVKSRGAFKNDKQITVRREERFENTAVIFTFPRSEELKKRFFRFLTLNYHKFRTFRNFGATALDMARFAEGVGGVIVEANCRIWDIAAGKLISEEAGGELRTWEGESLGELDLEDVEKRYIFISGNKNILNKIFKELKSL